MLARLDAQLKGLSNAYFALVMATGIISLGAHLLDLPAIAVTLFAINIVAYVVLWVLYALRLIRQREAIFADLSDHRRSLGYLTVVAATCVLGSQMLLIGESPGIATALLIFGAALWLVLIYMIFATLMIKSEKPSLAEGINGGWLLAVVSTQSIAVLIALLSNQWEPELRLEANFIALSMWLWGGMLYIWLVSLIFYRYMFFRFAPTDLTPPFWINMGAMAISVLAGSLLITNTPDAPFLQSLQPFLEGFTVFYWATGTWWIPVIVILAVWRYGYCRTPLTYDPLYWGAVFPIGMYAVSTYRMSEAMPLEFLGNIPKVFFWLALIAWAFAFFGMARRVVAALRELIRSPRSAGRVA